MWVAQLGNHSSSDCHYSRTITLHTRCYDLLLESSNLHVPANMGLDTGRLQHEAWEEYRENHTNAPTWSLTSKRRFRLYTLLITWNNRIHWLHPAATNHLHSHAALLGIWATQELFSKQLEPSPVLLLSLACAWASTHLGRIPKELTLDTASLRQICTEEWKKEDGISTSNSVVNPRNWRTGFNYLMLTVLFSDCRKIAPRTNTE